MSIDTITTDLTEAERLGLDLWQRWTALWNGDLALADQLLSPGFRIHFGNAVSVDTDTLRGPADLVAFIAQHRAQLPGVRYEPDGPPIVAFEVVTGVPAGRFAARWTVRRTDGTGRPVRKSGIDMLAVTDGRITGVWSVTGDRLFGQPA
jgi:hypothetical protein